MSNKITTAEYNGDFGFTHVSEDQIVNDAELRIKHELEYKKLQLKLDFVVSEINKLLENLKKNPEKEYIHWPKRIEHVNKFEQKMIKKLSE